MMEVDNEVQKETGSRGVNGEFYPCKAEIFEKTYEKVDD